jgi:hypothetical protein
MAYNNRLAQHHYQLLAQQYSQLQQLGADETKLKAELHQCQDSLSNGAKCDDACQPFKNQVTQCQDEKKRVQQHFDRQMVGFTCDFSNNVRASCEAIHHNLDKIQQT